MPISRSTWETPVKNNLKETSYGPKERNKSINEKEEKESFDYTKNISKKSRLRITTQDESSDISIKLEKDF
jgi:hypothetical protein